MSFSLYAALQFSQTLDTSRPWSHSQKLKMNSSGTTGLARHFHSMPDGSRWVFVQQGPYYIPPLTAPYPSRYTPKCTHTVKLLNLQCHTLSVIDRVQMLSGTHAARSGGGWITLFARCSALVTYFSLLLLQLQEEPEGGRVRLGSR